MSLLVAVLGAPVAWMVHLMASYMVVGLACAMGWPRADASLVALTVVCLLGAVASGVLAFRHWAGTMHQDGWKPDVMLVGVLGAGLFVIAIILEAVVPAFVPLCPGAR
jgi:hypothetical protein